MDSAGDKKRPLTANKSDKRIEHRNGVGFRELSWRRTKDPAIADHP